MKSSVTHIIHNGEFYYVPNPGSTPDIIYVAWPVDFNLALSSFEKSIRGVKNLVDFSLTSPRFPPPTLIFTSSIGVFQSE